MAFAPGHFISVGPPTSRAEPYRPVGHKEIGQEMGRAKAGLAQLSRNNVGVRKQRMITKSYRLQVQVLHFPSTRLLWINSYFPTDP